MADDINQYLLSQKDVLQCVLDEAKGRIVVATKSFCPGDVIYKEPPLHSVEENDGCNFFAQLDQVVTQNGLGHATCWYWFALNSLTADDWGTATPPPDVTAINDATQRKLLLLHAPEQELTDNAVQLVRDVLAHLLAFSGNDRTDLAKKFLRLLLAWKYNSFDCAELNDTPNATVYFGSSFHSHDCNPNASWSQNTESEFVLRARRLIPIGDEICISYLSDEELIESTTERRRRLQLSKGFHCNCHRCSEPFDNSRGFLCGCIKEGAITGIRFLASSFTLNNFEALMDEALPIAQISECSNKCCWCSMTKIELKEILMREDELVKTCRLHSNRSLPIRLQFAEKFQKHLEDTFGYQHWTTERIARWSCEGCKTKLEARTFSEKRVSFLRKVCDGLVPNSHHAWALQDLAMWTAGVCGAVVKAPARPTREALETFRDMGTMSFFEESLYILRIVNGEQDKYYLHVDRHTKILRDTASEFGVAL